MKRVYSLFAASVAFAGMAAMTPALAIPYTDGLSLRVADKVFTFDSCSIAKSASGTAGITSCGQLQVVSLTTGVGTSSDPYFYGFGVNGLIAAYASGGFVNVTMKYRVDVDPGMLISDAHAVQTSSGSTFATLNEVLMNGAHAEGSLHTDGTANVASILTTDLVSHLDVTTIYGVSYNSVNRSLTQLSAVNQLFSQVPDTTTQQTPEPATLALFGAGLIGLGALRRRRRK